MDLRGILQWTDYLLDERIFILLTEYENYKKNILYVVELRL
jgi:hypothetical protein